MFLAGGRYKLKGRVKKIYFQSDLKVAVVVINHGEAWSENCFPYHYLIFEALDGEWKYFDRTSIRLGFCSHTPPAIF